MQLAKFFRDKIFFDRNKLHVYIQEKRSQKKLVFTNGCFDILHPGHVIYLYKASQLGDLLVVGLNSDASVRRLKGSSRPLHSWEDRAIILASLGCVDFVLYFDEDTPEKSIESLCPQIHCKGGDYKPEDLPETQLVQKLGGEVRILPFLTGHSTTQLINRIHSER